MPFKSVLQKFNASIQEVCIGTGDKTLTLGGENVFPLYSFDEPVKNPPKVFAMVITLAVRRLARFLGTNNYMRPSEFF